MNRTHNSLMDFWCVMRVLLQQEFISCMFTIDVKYIAIFWISCFRYYFRPDHAICLMLVASFVLLRQPDSCSVSIFFLILRHHQRQQRASTLMIWISWKVCAIIIGGRKSSADAHEHFLCERWLFSNDIFKTMMRDHVITG